MVGIGLSKVAAAVAVAAAVSLCSAAPASALGERDTGGFGQFSLKASNGYRVLVLANSGPGYRHGEVLVFAGRKGRGVIYRAPATVTDTEIDADLGPVGRIAVKFELYGVQGEAAPVCEPGDSITYDKGAYVGEIEIHGEEGYTDISATRAPFSLHPFIDSVCASLTVSERSGPGLPGALLLAWSSQRQGKRVAFRVNQNRPGARVRVQASVMEERGPIWIRREMALTFPAAAFHFDRQLRRAIFAPPAPFSGSATFHRNARPQNRLTGSLAVDFPGRSSVSLTGARFRSRLVPAHLTEEATSSRPNLSPWPSTRPWPTASATSSPLAPS